MFVAIVRSPTCAADQGVRGTQPQRTSTQDVGETGGAAPLVCRVAERLGECQALSDGQKQFITRTQIRSIDKQEIVYMYTAASLWRLGGREGGTSIVTREGKDWNSDDEEFDEYGRRKKKRVR